MRVRWWFAWLIAFASVASCATSEPVPELPATRILLRYADGRTWISRGKLRRPLGALDTARVLRLTRVLFPDCGIVEEGGVATLDVDSPESATALFDGLRWVDGMILARRGLREEMGTEAASDAGIAAETIRRWLMVDPPAPHPDWAAMSEALDNPGLWRESPRSAALGAIVYAGILTRDTPSEEARNRAGALLAKAVVAENVPGWLSWIAYHAWSTKDFLAGDEN